MTDTKVHTNKSYTVLTSYFFSKKEEKVLTSYSINISRRESQPASLSATPLDMQAGLSCHSS